MLAADVAGYTRLMAEDEAATLDAWWAARKKFIDPTIAAHGGRIVKHTGDGFLAEFTTATEAVRAAVEMQTELAAAVVVILVLATVFLPGGVTPARRAGEVPII